MRTVILVALLETIQKNTEVSAPLSKTLHTLCEVEMTNIDHFFTRAKPTHPNPKKDFAWVWHFMYSESVTEEFRGQMQLVINARTEGLRFAKPQSKDGPIVKWLQEWLKSKRG